MNKNGEPEYDFENLELPEPPLLVKIISFIVFVVIGAGLVFLGLTLIEALWDEIVTAYIQLWWLVIAFFPIIVLWLLFKK